MYCCQPILVYVNTYSCLSVSRNDSENIVTRALQELYFARPILCSHIFPFSALETSAKYERLVATCCSKKLVHLSFSDEERLVWAAATIGHGTFWMHLQSHSVPQRRSLFWKWKRDENPFSRSAEYARRTGARSAGRVTQEICIKVTAALWVQKSLKLPEENTASIVGKQQVVLYQGRHVQTGNVFCYRESMTKGHVDHLSKVPTSRGSSEVACRWWGTWCAFLLPVVKWQWRI